MAPITCQDRGVQTATRRDVSRYITATTMQRIGALIVDILLFIVTVMVPATLISWWFGPEEFTVCEFAGSSESCSIAPDALRFTRAAAYALAALWAVAYAFVISTGASPGKRATEILVVDATTGETIGYLRALARTVIAVLGVACFGLGLFVTITNPHRRALHDLVVGTRVISP